MLQVHQNKVYCGWSYNVKRTNVLKKGISWNIGESEIGEIISLNTKDGYCNEKNIMSYAEHQG